MTTRTWQFIRAGDFDQVRLSSGADLLAIGELDQKLWMALACPTKGLEFDGRTLELLDTEKDGRIRASELIAATKWVAGVHRRPEELLEKAQELPLASIDDSRDEGRRLLTAAQTVLSSLGHKDASSISIQQATDAVKSFDKLPFNGDGVVPITSAPDEQTRAAVRNLLDTMGTDRDRSGTDGFSQARLGDFFKELEAHAAWLDAAEMEAAALPWGGDSAQAYAAFSAVKPKVDDYFARCRLAAFDARAIQALNREEKEYLPLVAKDLHLTAPEVEAFPLSRIEANRPLPLTAHLNPAWEEAMATFRRQVLTPLLGPQMELTEAQWHKVRDTFAGFEKWQGAKKGALVEKLGPARVRELLKGDARARLDGLLAKEKEQESVAKSLVDVERLARYHRDLYPLANNFVAFGDFYERKGPAVFQAGTLYLDQRACELCIRVDDAAKHLSMGPMAHTFLAYCDCARPGSGEKMSIVAAFTAGDSDHLMVGRNGVFYDRQGRDWDATITRLVDHPISVRQAFFTPYKKLIRFVEEQLAKRAAAGDTATTEKLTSAAKGVEKAAETGTAEGQKKIDIGTVAALGVAVGGITAALGAMLGAFFGLGLWMPLGLVGLVLGISGPSMAIAWLKLRQRNLGPLLDANGWALNSAARINIPFGASLTMLAVLPPGARRNLADPFAEKQRPWGFWVALLAVIVLAGAWYLGKLDSLLPLPARSVEVLGKGAPAYKVP